MYISYVRTVSKPESSDAKLKDNSLSIHPYAQCINIGRNFSRDSNFGIISETVQLAIIVYRLQYITLVFYSITTKKSLKLSLANIGYSFFRFKHKSVLSLNNLYTICFLKVGLLLKHTPLLFLSIVYLNCPF